MLVLMPCVALDGDVPRFIILCFGDENIAFGVRLCSSLAGGNSMALFYFAV